MNTLPDRIATAKRLIGDRRLYVTTLPRPNRQQARYCGCSCPMTTETSTT